MPDVVVVRIPKEEKPPEKPPPPTLLARFRRVLGLPLRVVWGLLLRLWRRLFGPRPKP